MCASQSHPLIGRFNIFYPDLIDKTKAPVPRPPARRRAAGEAWQAFPRERAPRDPPRFQGREGRCGVARPAF